MPLSKPLQEWLAVTLNTAVDQEMMTKDDIIQFASPEILSNHLPPEVMSEVLAASLKVGTMSPEVIIDTAGYPVMSENIPPPVLWAAIKTAGNAALKLDDEMVDQRNVWVSTMIAEGLRLGLFNPMFILSHMTPEVMAIEYPHELMAEVLSAGLATGTFDPDLVVETVGPERIALHVSYGVVWECLAEKCEAVFRKKGRGESITAEYALLDDEMVEDLNQFLDDKLDSDGDGEEAEIEVIKDDDVEELDASDAEMVEELSPEDAEILGELKDELEEELDEALKEE